MRIRQDQTLFDAFLEDDGTLDTVISVQPVKPKFKAVRQAPVYWSKLEARYSDTADLRNKNGSLTLAGFKMLAHDAASRYDFFSE